MKKLIRSVGPAIVVAAVVLGPGSILTSSKVGAGFGLLGVPVILCATILMIAMVALAARIGVVYEGSPCDELAARLGRPAAIAIGAILFTLIAFFQSSNNIALIGGLEPMFGDEPLGLGSKCALLLAVNGLLITSLYKLRNLYGSVERFMKLLVGLMALAFLINFLVIFSQPRGYEPVPDGEVRDWIPLLGMIGTTFSVAGAFYQAYLVKEKGWGLGEARKGVLDSMVGISILGLTTCVILLTAWRCFHSHPETVTLASVGDVALQLEPLFGSAAKLVFCIGILAGALSSFLVNAMIGGTVMSDGLGKGYRLEDRWPLHLTTVAMLVGMFVGMAGLAQKDSTVWLITLAQAFTVVGIPALALALVYLGTRKDLKGERKIPRPILGLAILGFLVSCILACLTALKVWDRFHPPDESVVWSSDQPQKKSAKGSIFFESLA